MTTPESPPQLSERSPSPITRQYIEKRVVDSIIIIICFLVGWEFAAHFLTSQSNSGENAVPPEVSWVRNEITGSAATGYQLSVDVNVKPAAGTHTGIQYVDVTIKDKNGNWINICRVPIATITDKFECDDKDITANVIAGMTVTDSVNVVDTKGNWWAAPNGVANISVPTVTK